MMLFLELLLSALYYYKIINFSTHTEVENDKMLSRNWFKFYSLSLIFTVFDTGV